MEHSDKNKYNSILQSIYNIFQVYNKSKFIYMVES